MSHIPEEIGIASERTWCGMKTKRMSASLALVSAFVLFLGFALSTPAMAAVNVYFSNTVLTSLQADFIAAATAQFNATLVSSPYFPGTYTMNILSKKPAQPSPGQAPCDLDNDIKLMVRASTWSYVYGFADGQAYERHEDLNTIGNMAISCSTTTTCSEGLSNASTQIYQQNFADPTVIPTGF